VQDTRFRITHQMLLIGQLAYGHSPGGVYRFDPQLITVRDHPEAMNHDLFGGAKIVFVHGGANVICSPCLVRGVAKGQFAIMSQNTSKGPPAGQKPGPNVWRVPPGDDRERLVCDDCGFVHYDNPKIVVGSVPLWEDKVLLCRRAIEPRIGYWTLPGGFMELHETSAEGAAREAWEEARANIKVGDLFAVYNIPRISQVQLFYRARLLSPDIEPGPESQEVQLCTWDDIPWGELAFPSSRWALDHFDEIRDRDVFEVRTNPPGETASLRRD
jgi:ADP-ribose pyrophosphatase YjhB (NUDIX family)